MDDAERQIDFWSRIERFPPILVRLLARTKPRGPALTTTEIAKRSGLTANQVAAISEQVTWNGIDVYEMRAFLNGCNLNFVSDPASLDRIYSYLRKRPTWKFLRVHPQWREVFEPLLRRYRDHLIATAKAQRNERTDLQPRQGS